MLNSLLFCLAKEPTLLEELWEYFVEKYFTVNLPYLENFTIKSGGLVSIQGIVIGITFGIIIASIGMIYTKRYIGNFIRRLTPTHTCLIAILGICGYKAKES